MKAQTVHKLWALYFTSFSLTRYNWPFLTCNATLARYMLTHWNFEIRSIVRRCFRDPTSSRLDTIPACHRRTDGQMDRHTITAYAALA